MTFYFMLEPFIEPNIKYIIASNVSNISLLEIYDGFQNFGSAIQGMVIFDTWINSCPMESISRNSPLQLNDETQTIYIQSSFYKNKHRRFPCKWKFMAPNEEYGFKIVILKLNISDSTKLIIKNSTNVFLKLVSEI